MDEHDSKFFNAQLEWVGKQLQASPGNVSAVTFEVIKGLAVFLKNKLKWLRE